jgi:hypothetical protein
MTTADALGINFNGVFDPGARLLGYNILFICPDGTSPGFLGCDVGETDVTLAANGQIILLAGISGTAQAWTFDPGAGLIGPAGFSVDNLGNVDAASLSIGGNPVQMPHIANLPGSAVLADVITAFNTLLAELQTAGLMA